MPRLPALQRPQRRARCRSLAESKVLMKRAAIAASAALLMLATQAAGATDLLQAWQAAQRQDPEYAAAHAAFEAGSTRRAQARGLWLPSVLLNAGAGRASSDNSMTGAQFSAPGFGQSSGVAFDTSVRNGSMGRLELAAKQPLLSRERLAQSRQLSLGAEMADVQWQDARQALMLRVAERYFEVLVASETLHLLLRQQAAVQRALSEAKDRFQLGDAPVIDTHEAAARAETIGAQVLAADMELQLKQIAFADLTGGPAQHVAPLRTGVGAEPPSMRGVDYWIAEAALHNPQLLMQEKNLAIAQEEAAKHGQGALGAASLDLVGQVGRERLHGSGDFGNAENRAKNWMIGLQLTVPLFNGHRDARHEEAVHLLDKTRAEGTRLRQQIALRTRAAWLGITVGAGRAAALEQARKASLSRLDATRVGQSVGDRTTLDLLNAENEASATELALLQARIGVALDRLRLAALAGKLDEEALNSVNKLIQGPAAH
ncbi:MAG TPA: TolC family protein [Telluria sp.]